MKQTRISVPDPAHRCRAWGANPASFDIDLANSRHDEAARERVSIPKTRYESKIDAPERPCARCAQPFQPSVTRRLLCKGCFDNHG